MILNIPFQTDLILLQEKRQQKIDARLKHANSKRKHFDFQPGMKVFVSTARNSKLDDVFQGPYEITATHTNGTVTIKLSENMTDRINIRRLKPN